MYEVLMRIEKFINKYYKKYLMDNPYEEFLLFLRKTDKAIINYEETVEKLLLMIKNRTIKRRSLSDIYQGKFNYDVNLKGVKELRKIYDDFEASRNYSVFEDERNEEKLYYLTFILEMLLSSTYRKVTYRNVDDYLLLIKAANKGKAKNNWTEHFFRGQSNSKWNLIPSCLRNINQKNTHILKYDNLMDLYDEIGVKDLYLNIINSNASSYEMVSFMQHAISFSPLIDFTTNIVVATYFALANFTNINNFMNENSSIFVLQHLDEGYYRDSLEYDDLSSMKIGIYKKGVRSSLDYSIMFREMGRLYGTDADTKILLNKTNDRMKYQSGLFVFFDDYIIDDPNTNVIFNRRLPYSITKVIIDKSIKKELLNILLLRFPNYNVKYLMNPYSRFEEK